ncbi:MAG: dehydrogenase [Prevotella sp.]|nr:dehydrogenase [Candidatus Prevotella equi]
MADNYLEYHHEEYEQRKARWIAKKKHMKSPTRPLRIHRPDDEAL